MNCLYYLKVLHWIRSSLECRWCYWFLLISFPVWKTEDQLYKTKSNLSTLCLNKMTGFLLHVTFWCLLFYQSLIEILHQKFPESDTEEQHQAYLKPFRILISLLDKPEIGNIACCFWLLTALTVFITSDSRTGLEEMVSGCTRGGSGRC